MLALVLGVCQNHQLQKIIKNTDLETGDFFKLMAENETTEETTQETAEEVTEAVETQSPATEKGIEEETSEADAEETAETEETAEASTEEETADEDEDEEISYHAVEKEGEITAIWEMQGRKHIRTISPRSTEGQKILNLFTSEIHETDSPPLAAANE
jgi:hypothetical protein